MSAFYIPGFPSGRSVRPYQNFVRNPMLAKKPLSQAEQDLELIATALRAISNFLVSRQGLSGIEEYNGLVKLIQNLRAELAKKKKGNEEIAHLMSQIAEKTLKLLPQEYQAESWRKNPEIVATLACEGIEKKAGSSYRALAVTSVLFSIAGSVMLLCSLCSPVVALTFVALALCVVAVALVVTCQIKVGKVANAQENIIQKELPAAKAALLFRSKAVEFRQTPLPYPGA